jgi:NAD(P)-dependent dehydrogenase (short-subunit alcohol dehydrogenase family)
MLESKNIVITGGSLGIGFAVASRCACEGANVVIAARNKNDLKRAFDDLNKVSNSKHSIYSLDVGDLKQVDTFRAWYQKEIGKIDGLVNCAGIYGPIGKTNKLDMRLFQKTLEINFLGTVFMCHAFYPLFGGGSRKKIVNFSGGGAATPFPNYSAYATSKAAVVRFTENLAMEWCEEGFDVNCVAPGFVKTRLHQDTLGVGAESAGEAFFTNTKKQIESGGVSAELAAELTVYLLSNKSDGITGKFISAPWDPWKDEAFQERLKNEKDLATLRRIDDKMFFKK